MAPRLLFQLVLFMLPFILFGIYRLAIAEAEQDGRKPWPIRVLFGAGLALFLGSWFILIMIERVGGEKCYLEPQIVDGVMTEGQRVPCDEDTAGAS